MFLSKLQILGFKSFPQKTELHFDRGITAIVGPNGCGKTNLLDALRWVLGEQRTTLLRSAKMEEVIFNGTKDLKPLGMAEVSLSIENTKGILPVDYNQITVTRRLFRSGESEYLLNKTPCRLKDITELFLDTGVGIHAYSVIQPEMVEAILSDRAEERRFLFEEASGITKYKLRKKEAERKLEYTENDLLRLNDILAEVEKQVNSLRRQKGKAERFKRISEVIKELEIKFSQMEYGTIREKEKELGGILQFSAEQSHKINAEMEIAEAKIEDLKLKILEKEREYGNLQKRIGEFSEKGFEIEREISIHRERRSNLEMLITKNTGEMDSLRVRLTTVIDQKESKKGEQTQIQAEIKSKGQVCEKEETSLLASDEKLQQTKEELEKLSSDWQRLNDRLNILKNERENVKTQIEELRQRQGLFTTESQSIQERINQLSEQLQTLSSSDEEKRNRLENQIREIALLKEQLDENESGLNVLVSEEGKIRQNLEGEKAKLELLRQISEHYEGYGKGEKTILSAKDQLPGIVDTVANLFTTKPEYLKAIESALGSSLQFIVCRNTESALEAIAYLKKENGGRATLLPLDKIDAVKINPPQVDLTAYPDAIGLASDMIECDPDFKKIVHLLLGNVVVVKSIEQALKLSHQVEPTFHLATLEGDLVKAESTLSGGSAQEISLLGRELEIHRLEEKLGKLNQKLNRLETEKESQEKEEKRLHNDLSRKTTESEEFSKQIQQSEIQLKTLDFEMSSLVKRLVELENQIQEINRKTGDLNQRVQQLEGSVSEMEDQKEKLTTSIEEKEKYQQETEILHSETFRKVNQLKIELVSLEGKEEQLKSDQLRFSELISEIENTLVVKDNEIKNSKAEIDKIAQISGKKEAELKQTFQNSESEKSKLNALVEEQTALQESLNTKEKDLKASRGDKEKIQDELHQKEMERLELTSSAKSIKDRIWEEYQIDLENAEPFSPQEMENVEKTRERLGTLKDRLKSTGPVNLLALEEFQTAKQRLDFLQNQVKDLTEAKETLISTIGKINQTAKTLFVQTFEQIRINFQQVFEELFEGGETELKLIESEDPLESPVVISARPFGKRLLNISQLSGGEKALTAIALLFSIYLVKPSPFCIFDEVDAPLDDANITRFLKLIRHFSTNTQFILITHNKLTMEAADVLYGVTMEQPGVSKIVSVKFEKHEVVTG
jgi:chromosome segregation protein